MIKHGLRSTGSSKHAFVNVFKISGTNYKNVYHGFFVEKIRNKCTFTMLEQPIVYAERYTNLLGTEH